MLKKRKQVLSGEKTLQKPLLLWPGIVVVMLQWLIRFGIPVVWPGATEFGVLFGLFGGLVIVVWWAFFSRASRTERWGAFILIIVAMVVTSSILHESIKTGMSGLMYPVYAIPILSLALVVWAVACRGLSDMLRRVMMVATILLSCGMWTLLRSNGITGSAGVDFAWRWAETPEQRFLAEVGDESMSLPETAESVGKVAGWPGFRGPGRDGVIHGVRIETDWSASPPVEMWRRSALNANP